MRLQKSKIRTLILVNLLCGSMLIGCSASGINYSGLQPLGNYKNTEGKEIKIYDIRAIEKDLAHDKTVSVDKINKFTNSLLVEVYKELEKGLDKSNKSYINERLLMVKDLHAEDMQMEDNIVSLMKIINDAFENKVILSKSNFYDKYITKRLEGLQSNPYDLLSQINENDLSVKEAMITYSKPRADLDDKIKEDINNYKEYSKYQLNIIDTAIKDDYVGDIAKLKSSVVDLKTNLVLLELSGNTNKSTKMYDNMIIDDFSKDVDGYDNAIRKLDILESERSVTTEEMDKAKLRVDKYKKAISKDLNDMKYEFGFDGITPQIDDLKEIVEQHKVK